MLDAFLVPLLFTLGLGVGLLGLGACLIVVASAAFVTWCWFRSLAAPGDGGADDEG